jgi:tetratricopeptide (TPR) repeat protein
LRYYPQLVDGGKDAAKYVTPARVAVPLLYLAAQPKSVEQLAGNTAARYSFMNEMKHSDVYIIALRPMKHANFSSYGLRIEQDDQFGDYTRDEVALAHSWAARYTRHFLDAYLKDDATGLAFVNAMPAANQAPPHMLFTDIRRKKDSAPPTLENFVQRLAAEGFDKAIGIYDQLSAQNTAFKLDPNEIYGWGAQLDRLNRPAQAREILRLGTHVHPTQTFLYEGLAEMQAKTGQTQEAVKSYRRVLELDPNNAGAANYLRGHGTRQVVASP